MKARPLRMTIEVRSQIVSLANYAPVAQGLERQSYILMAEGSIPSWRTIHRRGDRNVKNDIREYRRG